ncbi:AMP-binding protein [Ferroacidibacillus organovorans]|uniref:AMP-dependent synthetase n=1 Tax=Ferroacidibacillus organovorans TaxID=1765683 RepID=A0A853KBI6_9BACL|nr:AMP-binding protein [Ferroacidibacillus organovorans]KYP80973.1 hypothetical protein AYJ22_09325 [Ferroacidibacillus organovorans]OAG93489.1 hypothetical protein AYW79_10450 [Ferroacidibacillus organovorans]
MHAMHRVREQLKVSGKKVIYNRNRWYYTDQLRYDVEKVMVSLDQSGIHPADPVVLSAPNSYEWIVAYLGILMYGATVVPVNPQATRVELNRILEESAARGVIESRGMRDVQFELNTETAPAYEMDGLMRASISCDELGQFHLECFTQAKTNVPNSVVTEHRRAVSRAEGASSHGVLLFTSGTTGRPKGVFLPVELLHATADEVIASHHLTSEDVCYGFLPLFHINAQVVGLLSTLLSGGTLVLEERFSASRFWETVFCFRVTWISAVPAVISILLQTESCGSPADHVRFIRSASAPLPELHAHRFENKFGIPIIESYGMTEAASQVCVNPLPPERRKYGSVGIPRAINLRITGEQGEALPPNQVGEIALSGDRLIKTYASGDESRDSFRNGWFMTGDLGYQDEDGYVFITGRRKEMINRAGQKISPREVEDVLRKHSRVQGVAVIGLPDEIHGERVAAYIIPDQFSKQEELLAELKALCEENMAPYKQPAEIKLVDVIPAGPTGKVQRHRLREQEIARMSLSS